MPFVEFHAYSRAQEGRQTVVLPKWLFLAGSAAPTVWEGAQRSLQAETAASVELSNQLCGAEEYYCGGSNVYSEDVYAAAASADGPCRQDKDLGIWVCGTTILTNDSYVSLQSNKASCTASCMQSSVVQGAPTQYYWNASGWGTCPVQCNGALQTRAVSCVNSIDLSLAANSLCNSAARPNSHRPCGGTPCQINDGGLSTNFTAFADCEATCGSGLAVRAGYCANLLGELADVSACPSYTGSQLSRACASPAACSAAHWATGPWGQCWSSAKNQTVVCDGGMANRTVTCVNGQNQTAPTQQCEAAKLPKPPAQRLCNTAPCVGHTWQVGAFGTCSKACGGGIANRTVTCMDEFGNAAGPEQCPGLQPADQIGCNLKPCNFCKTTDCAGQGTCKNNVCVCPQGFRGDYCEIAPACTGILDQAGNCCPHGIVDINGTCCISASSTLDRYARCCESGSLDACGVCDGASLLVDVQAVCCASGVLDASGYCCSSGGLDECGVCDGDGSACSLHAVADVQVSRPNALLTFGPTAFVTTFASFMAAILGVNASLVVVSDYVLTPGSVLSPSSANVGMQVDFEVQPPDSFSAQQDLRASVATVALQNAVGAAASNELFILTAASSVARASICGNGVCEPGERSPAASGLGCAQDCPFEVQTCPGGDVKGRTCSGKGSCLTASGTCVCHYGYQAAGCSQCAEGFIRYGATCARYVKADLPLLDAASSRAAGTFTTVLVIGIVLMVIAAALLIIAVIIIVHQRRRLAEFRNLTNFPGRQRPSSRRELMRRGSANGRSAATASDGAGGSTLASQFAHQLRRKIPFSRAQADAQLAKQPVEHPVSRYMSTTVRAPVNLLDVARLQSSTAKTEALPPPLTSRSSQEGLTQGGSPPGVHGPSRLSGAAEPSPLRAAVLNSSHQQQPQSQPEPSSNQEVIRAALPDRDVHQSDEHHLGTIAESGPAAVGETAPLLGSVSIQPRVTEALALPAHRESSTSAGHAHHRLKQTSSIPPDILSDEEIMPHPASGSHAPPSAAAEQFTDWAHMPHSADSHDSAAQLRSMTPQLRPLLVPRSADSLREPAQSPQHISGQSGSSGPSAAATRPRQPRVSDMDTAAILHRVQSRREVKPKRHRPKRVTGDLQEAQQRTADPPQQLLNTARTLLHRFTRSEKVPDEEQVPLSPRQQQPHMSIARSGAQNTPGVLKHAREETSTEMTHLQKQSAGRTENSELQLSDDESDSPASGLLSRHRTISA